jgi:hypothetical protein
MSLEGTVRRKGHPEGSKGIILKVHCHTPASDIYRLCLAGHI